MEIVNGNGIVNEIVNGNGIVNEIVNGNGNERTLQTFKENVALH